MAINRIKTGGITDGTIQSGDIAPGTIASDRIATGTIANDRLANSSITINGNAVALGGSITAGTDWQAVTVADGSTQLTAEAGKGYFLDTNTGVIEVFLPSSPSRGDTVILADYSGTFATNKVLVNTGGKLIDSTVGGPAGSNEFELTTNNLVVELVFVDDDKGWLVKENSAKSGLTQASGTNTDYDADLFITATGGTVTESGDFRIHTFTGDGNFVVCKISVANGGNPAPNLNTVSYVVVAGGGGGAAGAIPAHGAGGGGAGGFRENKGPVDTYTASPLDGATDIVVTAQTYPITVGGGGPSGPGCANDQSGDGSNSVFSTITSTGGGGAGGGLGGAGGNGRPGGSGGGGSSENTPSPPSSGVGGTGNTPPVSPAQGTNGGSGVNSPPDLRAGGGGGATSGGTSGAPGDTSGVGGTGATTNITGSPVQYAGGGGGGGAGPSGQQKGGAATGGGGAGGGNAGPGTTSPGVAGTANTGGGGGGGKGGPPQSTVGGAGGKGVVIIRYKYQ